MADPAKLREGAGVQIDEPLARFRGALDCETLVLREVERASDGEGQGG